MDVVEAASITITNVSVQVPIRSVYPINETSIDPDSGLISRKRRRKIYTDLQRITKISSSRLTRAPELLGYLFTAHLVASN